MITTFARHALAAGVSFSALMTIAAPAFAQSEIEALREQMRQMQERIDKLEGDVTETRSAVDATRKAPVVVPDKDVRLEISGRINQGLLFADNGEDDKVFLVDNDNSGSRFGFRGEKDFGKWTAGSYMEVTFEVNSTDEIKFDQDEPVGKSAGSDDFLNLRDAIWYVEHKDVGTFSMGHSDIGTDTIAEADLSGTGLVSESDVDDTAGGLRFEGLSSLVPGDEDLGEVDDFFTNMDGSREQRILFESKSFAGFGVAAALRQEDQIRPDVGVTYGAEVAGFGVEAAGGWRPEEDSDFFLGSASVIAPMGVSLTLAGGTEQLDDSDNDDPNYVFAKLGYRTDIFPVGDTRFSVDVYRGNNNGDFAAPDGDLPEATSFGGGVVQKINPLSMEVYAAVRNYDVEDLYFDGQELDDPDNLFTVLTGARVRF